MNESGPPVASFANRREIPVNRVVVVHDEIDLPFGEVRVRLGGGLAGHNGLKSLRRELGAPDFHRVRIGVGRPDSTDPDVVAAYVLGRWRQPAAEVTALVDRACEEVERLVTG
jgi:PTH1 family peptidyl-tRNA hydrolase